MSDARARTPRPVPDRRDLRGLSLSPTDGFVLSRVDGTLTEHDLVSATGLPAEMVATSLATLEAQGIITYANGPPAPTTSGAISMNAPGPQQPSARQSSVGLRAAFVPPPIHEASSTAPPAAQAGPPATEQVSPEMAAALAEQVELDDAIKRAVLVTFERLERTDHYGLLNAERSSDRKGIKRAYYEVAGRFHPDKYFRKNLGSFKAKMEAIFSRVTLAHDVLSDREKRAEYDAYLVERRRLLSAEDLLAEAAQEIQRVEQSVERQVRAEGANPSPAGGMPAAAAHPSPAPPKVTSIPAPNVDVAMAARRDALARRLLGGLPSSSAPPARGHSSGPPAGAAPAVPSTADAMDALRRRYQDRVVRAKAAEARKYVANAKSAEAAGDPIAAANAYRVASQLVPDDVEVRAGAQAAQTKADTVLGDNYSKQASYEERNQQWPEASRSWSRVCKARPNDARTHERAANAALMASTANPSAPAGDLHEAARLAKRACEIEPANPAFRVTLAKVYVAAGLGLAARRELETGAQLAPQDDTIRSMLKKL